MRILSLLFFGAFQAVAATSDNALDTSQLTAPPQPLSTSDKQFIEAMYDAPLIFHGKLFTGYREQCLGKRCTYEGVVFKIEETFVGDLSPYEEGGWIADEENLWQYPSEWLADPQLELFEVDKEYLVMGYKDDQGLHITGVRPSSQLNQIVMQFELGRIGRR